MENIMLRQKLNTAAHSDAMRRHYAALFNTDDYLVLWWDELTPDQQERAAAQFSGYNMDGYVYECNIGGGIVARHERCPHDRQ